MSKIENSKIKVGYVIVSNEIMLSGKAIGFFYREEPDNENDSGWRFFSGEESEDYIDDPNNFRMYNASTILSIDPSIAKYLSRDFPVDFERDGDDFVEVDDA